MANGQGYAARLTIDRPNELNRLTTFFRIIWAIPIFVIYLLITDPGGSNYAGHAGNAGMSISAGLGIATALMIVFRQRYPRWWFDFAFELMRFGGRIFSYIFLLFFGLTIAVIIAWLAILFTGTYPRALFDYVEGVMRWSTRVWVYAFMMLTDQYPPFSLK